MVTRRAVSVVLLFALASTLTYMCRKPSAEAIEDDSASTSDGSWVCKAEGAYSSRHGTGPWSREPVLAVGTGKTRGHAFVDAFRECYDEMALSVLGAGLDIFTGRKPEAKVTEECRITECW